MDKISAKNAVRALALGDRIVFTLHAKKRDPSQPDGWKMRITRLRDQEKHEVVCVLILAQHVLVITGYGYARRAR
jgi:hypothetical protein